MTLRFAKAHGLGNDFILVEAGSVPADSAPWARALCDRHTGIGADGILAYRVRDGIVTMRLINADGGEAQISANGMRCLGAYAFWRGLVPARHLVDATGPRGVEVESRGGQSFRVKTDLGVPFLRSDLIPMDLDPVRDRVVDHGLDAAGERVHVTASSFANPHCTVFVDVPATDAVVSRLGPALERHPVFPERTNVEFATVLEPSRLRVRFWERGVGPTRASGTGSAAALVAAVLRGRCARRVIVECDGGPIECEWGADEHMRQTADVEIVFEGEWLGSAGM
jgi:diaminopimelate epimerase